MKPLLKLNNENNIYYNVSKSYSYDMFMHIIMGGRGIGKTTSFLIKGIQNFINRGEEFIYLRRYKTEIKNFVNKDSISKIADGIIYKGDGAGGYSLTCDNIQVGYCIPLSTTRSYKSVNFDKVTMIIFDEAIVKRGGKYFYLSDEVVTLLEFISTVIRTRNNVKVFILGNNEDLFNPYFEYFKIPPFDGRIYTDRKKGIYVELAKNSPVLLEKESKTSFFKLIKDTDYGEYHYNNEVLSSSNLSIINKPSNCSLYCRLVIHKETYNLYTFVNTNQELCLFVEHRNKIIEDDKTYILVDDKGANYYYINIYRRGLAGFVERLYFTNRVYVEDKRTANIMLYIMEEI